MCRQFQYRTFSLANRTISNLPFVPKHSPAHDGDIQKVSNFVNSANKLLILTGAGISTESGIPDYRSEGVGLYARSSRRPVQYQDFLKREAMRKRYWARNYVGWPRFSSFLPNAVHIMIKDLEARGKVCCVVTQNVDRLHTKAGSKRVIELHGSAFNVICVDCNNIIDRHNFQTILEEMNPHMKGTSLMIRPDGDVDISQVVNSLMLLYFEESI
jgi:NAD-dependent deacetylase sirtuin 4